MSLTAVCEERRGIRWAHINQVFRQDSLVTYIDWSDRCFFVCSAVRYPYYDRSVIDAGDVNVYGMGPLAKTFFASLGAPGHHREQDG